MKKKKMLRRMTALLLTAVMLLPAVAGNARAAEVTPGIPEQETLPTGFYPNIPHDENGMTLQDDVTAVTTTFGENDTCLGDQLNNKNSADGGLAYSVYQTLNEQLSNVDANNHPGFDGVDFTAYLEKDASGQWKTAQVSGKAYYITAKYDTKIITNISQLYEYAMAGFEAWRYDHPLESCATTDFFDVYTYEDTVSTGRYTIVIGVDSDTPWTEYAELKSAAETFKTSNASKMASLSEIQKFKYIHDYLCNNLTYNYNSYALQDIYHAYYNNQVSSCTKAHNAYGALCGVPDTDGTVKKGYVVCEGYTYAMNLLCSEMGLVSISVPGYSWHSSDSTFHRDHIWNYIRTEETSGNYKWYGMDVTWDDNVYGNCFETTMRVNVDFGYDYFGYNDTFRQQNNVTQTHKEDTDVNYCNTWTIGYPALADNLTDTAAWVPNDKITVTPYSDITKTINILQNPDNTFQNSFGKGTFVLGSALLTDIKITGNEISETCKIPDGKNYIIESGKKDDTDTSTYTLTRASGFTDTMFDLTPSSASTGILYLANITLNGGSKTATAPMICNNKFTDNDNNSHTGTLALNNATVTGNTAATGNTIYAINSDGPIALYNKCFIYDNKTGKEQTNVLLSENSVACFAVRQDLTTDSKIGVTKNTSCGLCIMPSEPKKTLNNTDASVFKAEGANSDFVYNKSNGCVYYSSLANTGANTGKAEIRYLPLTFVTYGSSVPVIVQNLTNSSLATNTYYATYNSNGKMLSIKSLGNDTLDASVEPHNGDYKQYTLPYVSNDTAYAKIFVLGADGQPLSQTVIYPYGYSAASTSSLEEYESPQIPEIQIPSAA